MPVKKQKIIRKPLSFSIWLAFVWVKKEASTFTSQCLRIPKY